MFSIEDVIVTPIEDIVMIPNEVIAIEDIIVTPIEDIIMIPNEDII